jgi:hypothetical protein
VTALLLLLLVAVIDRPMGREAVKSWAKQLGVSARDLIALGYDHDPFYVGGEADDRKAKWFKRAWDRLAYPGVVHLRRMFYRLLSEDGLKDHNGEDFANTKKCWADFLITSTKAREMDLVNPANFVDRRNDPPRIFAAEPRQTPVPEAWVRRKDPYYFPGRPAATFSMPGLIMHWELELDTEETEVSGYDYSPDDQPYHLETVIEKTTMNDVLIPVCAEQSVNLAASAGVQSFTNALALLMRAIKHGKPARVFYDSDLDHTGNVVMPVSFARHVEFLATRLGEKLGIEIDLKLRPITLTDEQVEEYDLPQMPDEGKQGGAKFEEEHGGMVELDALEALHPGVFARIHEEAFSPYRDETLVERLAEAEEEAAQTAADQWTVDIADEVAQAESLRHDVKSVMDGYRREVQALQRRINTDLQPFRQQMEDIVQRINEKADAFDPELPVRPEAEVYVDVDEDDDDWLLDLSRPYLDQINAYRRHKGEPPIAWRIPEPPPPPPRLRRLIRPWRPIEDQK